MQSDINGILHNVTAETFPKHTDIDLILNLSPDLPPVLADEVKLKRAFGELIENSIDFQPQGGQLTVKSSLTDAKSRIAQLTRTQFATPIVRIDFIDHGPGLTEQDRARVFQPFYTKKAKGMGLGLSIVKGIIEAHGGAIVRDRQRSRSRRSGRALRSFAADSSAVKERRPRHESAARRRRSLARRVEWKLA